MTKIKIIKCSSKYSWYHNRIGETYIVNDGNSYFGEMWWMYGETHDILLIIKKEDAVEMNRKEKLEKIMSKIYNYSN